MTRLRQIAMAGLAAVAIGGFASSASAMQSGTFQNRLNGATIGLPLGALPPPGLYSGTEIVYLGLAGQNGGSGNQAPHLSLPAVAQAVPFLYVPGWNFLGATYGFGDEPWPETTPSKPDEIYGISKWMDEQIMERLHADRPEVRAVIARLFNTYGPRETNPHVLPDIMKCMRDGKPIELGNLWPKRDLIFVTDTAAGLVASASGDPGLEVFNIGTGTGTAIQDVLLVIEDITGQQLDVRQVPGRMREGDGHLISDPGKLMQATGWKPVCDLQTGLQLLLESEGLV